MFKDPLPLNAARPLEIHWEQSQKLISKTDKNRALWAFHMRQHHNFHCDAFKNSTFSLFLPFQAANVQKKLVNLQIPLFLRFLNLLINDSIFLLDEALQVLF